MSHDPRDCRRRKRGHHYVAEATRRRKRHNLLPDEVRRAKQMDERGLTIEEIADALDQPVRDVEVAMASTRSPNPESPFAVINTDKPTKDRFLHLKLPDETDHDTFVWMLDQCERRERQIKRRR